MGDKFLYAVVAVPELLEAARANAAVVKEMAMKAAMVKAAVVKAAVVKVAEVAVVKAAEVKAGLKAAVKVRPYLHRSGPVVCGT
jgi:hypothetical protein